VLPSGSGLAGGAASGEVTSPPVTDAAAMPAEPVPEPATIAPTMPGWMKHEYTYTPSSSNVYATRSFSPRSSNVPHVAPTPVTS
jgi:hypothetical protein